MKIGSLAAAAIFGLMTVWAHGGAEAGKALINFLKAPAAVPVLKAKGMAPFTP